MKSINVTNVRWFTGLAALAFNFSLIQAAQAGSFSYTGSMTTGRIGHTATLLPNGKVLVAGGGTLEAISAELYDSANAMWTVTAPTINGHSRPTATMLLNGKVLVAGATISLVASLPQRRIIPLRTVGRRPAR